jgi:hypothetical protein
MFQEMRHPVYLLALVTRAGFDEKTHRCRFGGFVGLTDNGQAIRQFLLLKFHNLLFTYYYTAT